MYGPDAFRLEASVRETVTSTLKKGQRLTAIVDALDKEFEALIDEIVPFADPGSRSFIVKAILTENTGLYPGMFGRLLIPIGQTERIYIPEEAITQVGQLYYVMVSTEKGVVRRYVRLGDRHKAEGIAVISGLVPGESIRVPSR
jgi:hypothetical protein